MLDLQDPVESEEGLRARVMAAEDVGLQGIGDLLQGQLAHKGQMGQAHPKNFR